MMADAAGLGWEMFVLDDGWFGNKYPRNGDNAGLGDWQANSKKLPLGIDYLAQHAVNKGIKEKLPHGIGYLADYALLFLRKRI